MAELLNKRNRQILEAVIEGHIDTAEPLGSGTVSKRCQLGLSPATVRNVMAQLEDMGYLVSPHASAGRVPTHKAYRYYVNSLLKLDALSEGQRRRIEQRYRHDAMPVEDELQRAGRTLAELSHYAGIVVSPRFSSTVFRHIEFVGLTDRRLLVIMVSAAGMVHKKLIETEELIDQRRLDLASSYLNRTLSGLSIAEAKERIARDVARERALYDELLRWTLRLSEETLKDEIGSQLFIEGALRVFDQPEFADLTRTKQLLRFFEQKSLLLELLDKSQRSEGVRIFIPDDQEYPDMQGCSLITARYVSGQGASGSIGILGPMRMPYAQVVPVVDYMARLISGSMTHESI